MKPANGSLRPSVNAANYYNTSAGSQALRVFAYNKYGIPLYDFSQGANSSSNGGTGQAAITYANGFHIEAFRYPLVWSQVSSPNRMRTNVDNCYTLMVGNPGNLTANGVEAAMVWPKSVQLNWKANFYMPDYSRNDTLAPTA